MSEADRLRAARTMIEDPRRWAKRGAYAETVQGHPVDWTDPYAARWCALGACYFAGAKDRFLRQALKVKIGSILVGSYNDDASTSHTDILGLFDQAIELARREDERY